MTLHILFLQALRERLEEARRHALRTASSTRDSSSPVGQQLAQHVNALTQELADREKESAEAQDKVCLNDFNYKNGLLGSFGDRYSPLTYDVWVQ